MTKAEDNTPITEHDAVARAAAIERQRLFDLSLDMLCVAGLDGYFKQVNKAFMRVLGYDESVLLSQPFISFVHPDDVDGTWEVLSRQSAGDSVTAFENRYRDVDGYYRWFCWNAAPPTDDGLIYAVARDITDSRRMQRKLRYATTHDELTGMANRAHLYRQLKHAFERGDEPDPFGFAVMFIDLDGFRAVNERHGYAVGDELLRQAAQRITENLRPIDAVASKDVPARLSGDEFVILLDPINAVTEAHHAAGRLEAAMSEPYRINGLVLSVSATIGVVTSADGYSDPNAMLRAADAAMHQRKPRRLVAG